MIEFHHHPDNVIYLRGQNGVYAADRATFDADLAALAVPVYSGLPAGRIERRYERGDAHVRHLLFDGVSQFAGEEPWVEGDAIVARYVDLLARQAARVPVPPPESA